MSQRKSSSMQYIKLSKMQISNKPIHAVYVNNVNKFGANETYLKVTKYADKNEQYLNSLNELHNHANKNIDNQKYDEPIDFKGSYEVNSQKIYKIWINPETIKEFNELESGTHIEVQFTTDYYIYSWKRSQPKIKLFVSHVNKFKECETRLRFLSENSVRKNLSSEEQKTKNYPTYEEDD